MVSILANVVYGDARTKVYSKHFRYTLNTDLWGEVGAVKKHAVITTSNIDRL